MTIRLGVISDVHADVHALSDALAQLDKLGCERIVCCGDLVDYGKHPEETLRLLQERAIPCIRGNHDRWALERPGAGPKLSAEALAFLGSLPVKLDFQLEGVRIAVRHGQSQSDMEGIYPDQFSPEELRRMLDKVEADVLLVGHTHVPFVSPASGSGLVCNPGALLREPQVPLGAVPVFNPARGKFDTVELPPGGTFGVLELPALRFTVHRVTDGLELLAPVESDAEPQSAPASPRAPRLKAQWLVAPYAATAEQEAHWARALERGLQWEDFELGARVDARRATAWVRQRARSRWAPVPARPVPSLRAQRWFSWLWTEDLPAAPREPRVEPPQVPRLVNPALHLPPAPGPAAAPTPPAEAPPAPVVVRPAPTPPGLRGRDTAWDSLLKAGMLVWFIPGGLAAGWFGATLSDDTLLHRASTAVTFALIVPLVLLLLLWGAWGLVREWLDGLRRLALRGFRRAAPAPSAASTSWTDATFIALLVADGAFALWIFATSHHGSLFERAVLAATVAVLTPMATFVTVFTVGATALNTFLVLRLLGQGLLGLGRMLADAVKSALPVSRVTDSSVASTID